MFSGSLNYLLARERTNDLLRQAQTSRRGDPGATPVTRVTLRHASAADRDRLRLLSELDSAELPCGPMILAEVDGKLRAALPLDGSRAIADPFHRGLELVELLRLRAAQPRRLGA